MGELSSGAEPADWSNIGPKQRITHQWSDTARGEKRFPVRDVLTNHSPPEAFFQNGRCAESVEFLTKQLYSFGATATLFQFERC